MTLTRVICVGSEDNGDDAAGLMVARLLRDAAPAGVEVRETAGDVGSMIDLLAGVDRAIVVDAALDAGPPGTVRMVAPDAAPGRPTATTHLLGVGAALGLAEALGSLPRSLALCVIAGARFDPGPVTPEVEAGVRTAAGLILSELRSSLSGRPAPDSG